MKYLLDEEDQFFEGTCVFCGEDAKSKPYPGDGWNTYEFCDCLESQAYYKKYNKYTSELGMLCKCARAKKQLLELANEDKKCNKEIAEIEEKKRDILWEAKRRMEVIEGSNNREHNIGRKRRN